MKSPRTQSPSVAHGTPARRRRSRRLWPRRLLCAGVTAVAAFQSLAAASAGNATPPAATSPRVIRVGVLSKVAVPGKDTSQGLYINILKEAGMQARRVSAEEVSDGVLDQLDIFIIGGGSGTAFNASLGPDGGRRVTEFVRNGGGALGSCAGGYSFVRGHNEALRYIEIANARCLDFAGGRWARGKGVVEIAPEPPGTPLRKMFYANGPLWEITQEPGFGRTEALARFVTDIKRKGDPGGIMPGTPAILGGTFGRGRFVLFSAHPEFHRELGNRSLVVDAARWASRGPLASGEDIRWKDVFPSATGEPTQGNPQPAAGTTGQRKPDDPLDDPR